MRFRLGFRHYSRQGHGRSALSFALVGGFHEGEDFNGLFRSDGGLACLKKMAYLHAEFFIASLFPSLHDVFGAEGDGSEAGFVLPDPTVGAHTPILPNA